MPRIAKSLDRLRAQVRAAVPNGPPMSEYGWLGDKAHRKRVSDHNPDKSGVVRALDIPHDPAHGLDTYALAEYMRAHPDKRARFIVSNRRIAGSKSYADENGGEPWVWKPYKLANPHDKHMHVSVERTPELYDNEADWDINIPMSADHLRTKMAKAILNFEARRDKQGRLTIYNLPANDGGGRYEVAGINEKYDRSAVRELVAMIKAGKHAKAEAFATAYIASNTDPAMAWTTSPAVEFFLRDTVFNRGVRGAARILQRAVGVDDDGFVGPITKAAIASYSAADLLLKLRAAREDYERKIVGYRANFWTGLVKRWDGVLKTAQKFL